MGYRKTPIGEIPEEWKVVALGSVVEVLDSERRPLSKIERADRKGPFPYCGANGIIDHLDGYIFDGEFLLLAEDGGDFGAFGDSAYIMTGKFWVNNHAHVLKAVSDKTTNVFLLFALNFLDLSPYVVGSTRRKLNQGRMRSIHVALPPLPEQKNITEILSTVDEAIRKVDEAIANAERLKKGLMRELLTKGIGHKEFVFNRELRREIPKEWSIVRIREISDTLAGGTPSRRIARYYGGSIPWVKSGEVASGEIYDTKEKITEEGLKNSSARWVPKGTVLIAMYGATAGKVGLLRIEATTNQAVLAVPNTWGKFSPDFLYYMLTQETRELVRSTQGTGQLNLSKQLIDKVRIPLPPLPEQKKIAEILRTVDKKLELERARKAKLERLKKGLMNVLLTGKVRVKV